MMNPPERLPNHHFQFVKEHSIDLLQMATSRRVLFKEKGTICVTCGINCNRLIEGKTKSGERHLDLYDENLTRMLTVGHIVPKSRGGSNELSNLRPLCHICNKMEGCGFGHICEDDELFEQHLKGAIVRKTSGAPFHNGKKSVVVTGKFKSRSGKSWFITYDGGDDIVNKITLSPNDILPKPVSRMDISLITRPTPKTVFKDKLTGEEFAYDEENINRWISQTKNEWSLVKYH
jgi:hypothetical protein